MKPEELMENLGYRFRDVSLLRQALTHPSMGRNDNQRLEFLGDAVLQYIMSDILFATHPNERQGGLTHLRKLLVCEEALSQVAKKLGIGECLIMDRGEEMTGGREKPSVLCDAMEAVLAAIYLDGGLKPARDLIVRSWPRPQDVNLPMQDSKSALQQLLQKGGGETPTYSILQENGPPHARNFLAAVYCCGKQIGRGSGKTKKAAEQAAALTALKSMQNQ